MLTDLEKLELYLLRNPKKRIIIEACEVQQGKIMVTLTKLGDSSKDHVKTGEGIESPLLAIATQIG